MTTAEKTAQTKKRLRTLKKRYGTTSPFLVAQIKRERAQHAREVARDAMPLSDVMPPPTQNGAVVEHRLVLQLQGQEVVLSLADATHLRDALAAALPTP